VGVVSNIVLSTVLIYKFGFAGAVIGTACALILGGGVFIILFHRINHYPFTRVFLEAYLKPILCSAVSLAIVRMVHPLSTLSWFGLVAMGTAFGSLFLLSVLLSGFFDEYDWDRIERLVPIMRRVRQRPNIA
jgi:hypothetical protein